MIIFFYYKGCVFFNYFDNNYEMRFNIFNIISNYEMLDNYKMLDIFYLFNI